jgi:cation-transporting ATPase I
VLVRLPARTGLRFTRRALTLPASVTRRAGELPGAVLRAAGTEHPGQRQVWGTPGAAMLEVRGLDAEGVDRAANARAVQEHLSGIDGVTWARADPATRRIAVRFDRGRLGLRDIVAALTDAERIALAALGEPEEPDDDADDAAVEAGRAVDALLDGLLQDDATAEGVHGTAVTLDVLALAAAGIARLAQLPRPPASLAGLVVAVEHQPRIRRALEARLGRARVDLLLAVGNAVVNGVTRNVPALLLDTAQRTQTLRARQARRDGVALTGMLRGPEHPAGPPATGKDERPVPLPAGPVERLVDRMAPGALLGSAGLLATGRPDLAGRALLVGVPRAAHAARIGFVESLGIGLARRGIVVTAPAALTVLDRISTVVVQSEVLHNHRRLVLQARGTAEGWTDARVWRAAQLILDGERDGRPAGARTLRPVPRGRAGEDDDPQPAPFLLADGDATVGELLVGLELDPLADAVLSATREAGLRLALTEDAAAPELGSRADEVLRDGHGDPLWLRREVRRMQEAGEVVALVGTDAEALDAADLGIGVAPETGAVPWAADVVCGPGLSEVPRLVAAVPGARATSERGVRVALSATFIGGLLLAVGRPGSGSRAQLPVTMAGFGELLSGTRAASRVLRRPDPAPVLHTPWHALDPAEVLARLPDPGLPEPAPEDGDDGGTSAAARAWRLTGELVANVRAELNDPLTPVLATGAAASAVIGSPTDAVLVGGVLLGSALISGAQRMRAERALKELLLDQRLPARLVEASGPEARAEGGGDRLRRVPAARLWPGHLIALEAGDVVPADARLVAVDELELDEATLTGESTPVSKEIGATPGAELPDRTGMVYEGTTVLAGTGRAVVVAVGAATEAGRALALAGRARGPVGMQARLEELTRRGLPVTLLGGAAVTGMALLRGRPLRSAVTSGVSVAVAAVPEGLPLMATVAQLGAARRLSRRGVLVRASRTVEALGRVDTVCFDKTGTLTEGRLRLVRIAGLDAEWDPAEPPARRVLRAAGQAVPSPNGSRPLAHATDQAVLDAALAVFGEELDQRWEELTEVPFHSDRGFSAAVGRTPNKTRLVIKGAPEVVLPRCSHVRDDQGKRPLDEEDRQRAAAAVHLLASQGLRVLAVARRNVGDVAEALHGPDDIAELGDLTLLGFLGLADAPRPQAAGTVAALHEAGVRTVMITGDHPVTARAIAEGLGIHVGDLVTGPELAALDERARVARVAGTSVFARVSPEQKLQIVQALRQSNRIVAMVGDGANDAAAIRLADVGIGMSAQGSTSARSAADLVFTEPDVGLVLDALVEGRAMWRRVRDAVSVLLGGNLGEVAFTLAGTALAGHAPIGTRQFLVVNMFTDLLPSMALALAPTPADPRDRAALLLAGPPSLGAPLLRDIAFRGTVTSFGALAAWQIGRVTGTRRRASTIALAALVGAELGQTLLVGGRNPLVLATAVGSAAVLAGIIQIPGVSQFFGCTPLDPFAWGTVAACSAGATAASVVVPSLLPRLRRAGVADDSAAARIVRWTGNVVSGNVVSGTVVSDAADRPALLPVS